MRDGSTSRCAGPSSTAPKTMPPKWTSAFWLDYFKRIHADALCITAGGVVAFYPTKIKYHRPSRWLAKRPDYFRQVVDGCRKLGMVVVARTDPHATYEDVYRDHPDWIAVDAEGRKRRHWEMPGHVGDLRARSLQLRVHDRGHERDRRHFPEVGGIFSNRWEGSGMCYCEHCARNFRDYCGMDLPRTNNQRDPARRNYIVWREKRASSNCGDLWDGEIRKINPARPLHRELRRRQRRSRHARGRRTCAHPVRRSPGPQRRDGAVGQRQERQGVPLHAGPQSRSAESFIWAW